MVPKPTNRLGRKEPDAAYGALGGPAIAKRVNIGVSSVRFLGLHLLDNNSLN